ncbi:MAG: AIR synthase-related protein, partial [Candidatus Bathyarchaeia archaeon]
DTVVLLGETKEELGGSEDLKTIHGLVSGHPPLLDLDAESKLIWTLIEAAQAGILNSAHDLSEGGLAIALAESSFTPKGPVGVNVKLKDGRIREDALLFGESQSRAIVSIDQKNINSLERVASKRGVPMEIIGEVGGDRF